MIKTFVLNRLTVSLIIEKGTSYFNLLGASSPFVIISCFGNKYYDSEEIFPNYLIESDIQINKLKEIGMIDYLNIFCDDTTPEKLDKIPKEILLTKWKNVKLFDEQNAKDVYNFIKKYKHDINSIIVHCDAGISRSSAIALSICDEFNLTKEYIHDGIIPNKHILKICSETWKDLT